MSVPSEPLAEPLAEPPHGPQAGPKRAPAAVPLPLPAELAPLDDGGDVGDVGDGGMALANAEHDADAEVELADMAELTMGFAPPQDSMAQIAAWLEVDDPEQLAVVTEVLDDRTLFATGTAIRDLLDHIDEPVGGGLEGYGAPRWFPFDTRDPESVVPLIGWFGIPGGMLSAEQPPVALRIFLGQLGPTLEVAGPPGEVVAVAEVLRVFNDRRKKRNPLRRKLLRVGGGPGALSFRVADPPSLRRADVVLPPGAWDQIDRHVIRPLLTRPNQRMRAVLGSHSAVLIDGAAGTGKTTLCRALAAELAGQATVIYVEPATGRDALIEVYASAQDLAPALVVIEHAEAAAPARGTDMPLTLVQFSAAFDLASAAAAPIVTLLTTTEPTAIDGGFRQSSRVGLTIHLPVPDVGLRREILEVMLTAVAESGEVDEVDELEGMPMPAPIDLDVQDVDGADQVADGDGDGSFPIAVEVDAAAVARVTDGATGADLQHLMRMGVIEALEVAARAGERATPVLTTRLLTRLAAARGWVATDTGMYL